MPKTRIHPGIILAALFIIVVAAYTVAGYVGVPHLVRSQLQKFSVEHYGRPLSVGRIRFNPYKFALDVRDLSFPDTDGEPLLGFGRLLLDLDIASVWRRGVSFSDIEVDRPFTRALLRPDGELNLADLAKPFETSAPQPSEPEKPTRLFIDRFRVDGGEVRFEDHTRPSPFRTQLRPITFELRDFSTTGRTGNAYMLRGASAAGERFAWDGSFGLQPLASRGRFEVTDLQARTVWSYLRDALDFELSNGLIDFAGEYDFVARDPVQLRVTVGNVAISDLGIRAKGRQTEDVQLTQLQIDDTRLDLARERVDIGKIRVAGGSVRARRDEQGEINLNAPWAPDGEAEPQTESSSWVLAAPEIAIEGLSVAVEDALVKPAATFALEPVNLTLSGFSTAPDTKLQIDAKLGIDKRGELVAHAEVVPETGAATARVELSGFDLVSIQPYLNTYTQMTLSSGVLESELDVRRKANGALTIKGETEVEKLRTVDNAMREDFIKWDRLRVSGLEYESEPASLRIKSIAARGPYARLIIAPDQTVNISTVLSAAPGTSPAPVQTVQGKKTEAATLPVTIGIVRIANGSANFADFWIQPNYAVSIQSMNGSIVGLSSDAKSRAKVDLQGKVDRYAPAQIGGEINLLSAALFTDMKVSFKGVELTSVTPYSGRFAGYKIEKGKLSIDVAYKVQNRQLEAKQRFIIDQLQLGERVDSPDAVRLPLRLAVALLKDRNGVIDVDLPVSGSLDDPKFRLGPLIWKAVVGLLTKVATAPFALLGSLFGGGEEMNQVDFEPGGTTLDATGEERVAALTKALTERPQLQLEVPMSYSPDLDAPVLTTRKLDEKLLALAQEQPAARKKGSAPVDETTLTDPAQRFDLLLAQYQLEFGAEAALPPAAESVAAGRKKKEESLAFDAANAELTSAITEKQPVSERDLEALGQRRAQAIQDALLKSGEIQPDRVFLLGANQTKGADNKVRLELSLR